MRVAVASLLLAAVAGYQAAAQAGAAQSANLPTIYVNYTMSCTFGMTDAMGKTLASIPPGAYQILVTSPVPFAAVDLAGINDMTACKGSASFQLTGPGVSLTTTMDDGDSDNAFVYATFQPSSTYTAVDTTQPAVAHFTFTTTATGTATAPATMPTTTTGPPKLSAPGSASLLPSLLPPTPKAGKLAGMVTAGGGVKLTLNGKAVSALRAGRYVFTVTDRSKHDGFVLQQGAKKSLLITTGAFVGRHLVTLTLTKGEWAFYPSAAGAKAYFTVLG